MLQVRTLTPLKDQPTPPTSVKRGMYFVPKNPEDRGELSFKCPTCGQILIREMAPHYVERATPIWCIQCEVWLTPSAK